MNTSYRLVWNESTGTWSVAHEMARGKGKGSTRRSLAPLQAFVLIAALLNTGPAAHADVSVTDNTGWGTVLIGNSGPIAGVANQPTTVGGTGSIAIGVGADTNGTEDR